MKYLHASCLCVHGLIAGTLAHECWILGPAELTKIVHAMAYVALSVIQGIALIRSFRQNRSDEEAPVE